MSVPSLPRYHPSSNSLRTAVEGFKSAAESEAEKVKKRKSDYSGPLYIVPNDVKSALDAFLKEVGSYPLKTMRLRLL